MNKYFIALLALLFTCRMSTDGFAQNVNWKRVSPENKHLVYLGAGINYGMVASAGYAYRLPIRLPVLAAAEVSIPSGNNIFDDFKSKLGGQAELWRAGHFSAAVKLYGVFRRQESDYVRLLNFGSETGAVIGFYKRKWYVATEFTFDKAITTNVKHGAVVREYNPNVQDGWYIPTGGNFLYGIQSGLSFGKNDLNVSLGKWVTQDFKTTPLIPFSVQLGYNRRF